MINTLKVELGYKETPLDPSQEMISGKKVATKRQLAIRFSSSEGNERLVKEELHDFDSEIGGDDTHIAIEAIRKMHNGAVHTFSKFIFEPYPSKVIIEARPFAKITEEPEVDPMPMSKVHQIAGDVQRGLYQAFSRSGFSD